ncbi:nucleoside-diphosphate-sugar pyrophosphorylase [Clostridium fermenticellae]|uniref:Nucleoside-diphosphate-sugar pyrophosphorylase n=1 Tax=Clostridium fermenticellae TaxID=2068654 RepID=A0A386H0X7_9CLOT|nr:nucleotidyltransferase family protein [Clostridium fermenticellae]AYD39329.1 nucleoside-diphosphate-sugar pyrophosphorylase [Clostridium fermenticellae]
MQAVILVGGLGTRLKGIVNDKPKPMALANNRPFLEYLINKLKNSGITDIVLAAGYMAEYIKDYFEDGKDFGVSIGYSIESKQLGTGGALKNAERLLHSEDILILNGDTYFNINFNDMYAFHKRNKSYFTMALRRVDDVSRYGTVECNYKNVVTKFIEKDDYLHSNYINGGIYIINKKILKYIAADRKVSLENQVIPKVMKYEYIYGFKSKDYFIDIGIPEDYFKFCEDMKRGMIK